MEYTGVVRFAVYVAVNGENSSEGMEEAHSRISALMHKFLAMADEDEVRVDEVEAPRIVCY